MHATGERSWPTAPWGRRGAGDTMPALSALVADGGSFRFRSHAILGMIRRKSGSKDFAAAVRV
jgi:hypothetical protein